LGLSHIDTLGRRVITARPLRDGSTVLVAISSTFCCVAMLAGAK
jgi:hypothetical protein